MHIHNMATVVFGVAAMVLSLGLATWVALAINTDRPVQGVLRRMGYLGDGCNLQVVFMGLGAFTAFAGFVDCSAWLRFEDHGALGGLALAACVAAACLVLGPLVRASRA